MEKLLLNHGTMGKLTFGPIMIPEGFDRVMNDLSEEELENTHRQKAWKNLLNELKLGEKIK